MATGVSDEPTTEPIPERGVFATTEEKVHAWRLKVLHRAYTEGTYDDVVFGQLERLAASGADLWAIDRALRGGCSLATAVGIFA